MADPANRRKFFPGRVHRYDWVAVAALLIPALRTVGNLSWTTSAALGVPLALVSLFIPLAAGFVCRFTPLGRSVWWRTILTHVMAAQVLSFLWTLLGGPMARALAYVPQLHGVDKQLAPNLWIIYVTGALVYFMSIAFHYVVIAQEAAREVELRAVETSMLARDAELRALRAQINPHFLFNSLNSISALTSIDAGRAREMCLLLAEEKIEEGAKRCLIPALLLQPLLENAVSHGIASMAEGGLIRLEAQVQDGRLGILVENERDQEAPSRKRNGVGLKNVRSRLEARYGKEAVFRVEPSEERFRVSISLPVEYGENP
jgi:two-component system, LytTR family, sensor histidine kinase AlgZ